MQVTQSTVVNPLSKLKPDNSIIKSEAVLALEKRPRNFYEFELQGFLGVGEKVIGSYKMRTLTAAELQRASVEATRYIESICAGTELAKSDPDIVNDAKTCWALHAACKDTKHPEAIGAFYSPIWMMENLTPDNIAVLLNNFNSILEKERVMVRKLDDETVDAVVEACSSSGTVEMAAEVLSRMTREVLCDLVIRLAQRTHENQRLAGTLKAGIETMVEEAIDNAAT